MTTATRTARVVLDWDGRRWETTGELVRLVDRCELLDPGSSYRPRTAEVDIHLEGVIAWLAAKHHPRSGTAQLYLGERLVLDAPVQSVRPGRQGEPSRVTFGERPELDRSKVPATYEVRIRTIDQELTQARRDGRQAQRDRAIDFYEYARKPVPFELVVNSLTQPTAYSRTVEGRTYPRIFGRPGSNGVIASPALVIDQGTPKLLIAGHAVSTGTVTIVGPKARVTANVTPTAGPAVDVPVAASVRERGSESFTVTNTVDGYGRPVAVVDITGASVLSSAWTTVDLDSPNEAWFVKWNGTASGLSGDAVDIILDLLSHVQGVTIDVASIEALRAHLRPYQLSASLDASVPAWQVLTRDVLPLLPVRLVATERGVGAVLVRLQATSADASDHLVAGGQAAPDGPPRYASEDGYDPVTQWTLRWGANRETRASRGSSQVGPGSHAFAVEGASIHGLVADEMDSLWIYDEATANLVATEMLRLTSIDRRLLDIVVDADVYGRGAPRELRLGQVVTWTDSGWGFTAAVCLVAAIERDGGRVDRVSLIAL